jgi:hypothetical protein
MLLERICCTLGALWFPTKFYRGLQLLRRCHDGRVKRLDGAILRDVKFCLTQDTLDNLLVRAQLIQIRRDARRTATHGKAQGGNATTTSWSAFRSADPMHVINKIVSIIDTVRYRNRPQRLVPINVCIRSVEGFPEIGWRLERSCKPLSWPRRGKPLHIRWKQERPGGGFGNRR